MKLDCSMLPTQTRLTRTFVPGRVRPRAQVLQLPLPFGHMLRNLLATLGTRWAYIRANWLHESQRQSAAVNRNILSCRTYKMIGQLYVTFQGLLQLFMFTFSLPPKSSIPKVRNKTNQTKTRPRNGAPSSRLTRTRTREPLLELDAVVLRLLQRRLEVRGAALRRGLGHVPPHLGAAGDGRGVQSPWPIEWIGEKCPGILFKLPLKWPCRKVTQVH